MGSTLITVGSALLHVPPGVALVYVVDAPTHMLPVPVIIAGAALTTNTIVSTVAPTAYDIVVVPAVMPLTIPEGLMVATAGVLLDHMPPGRGFVRPEPEPAQHPAVPIMAANELKESSMPKAARVKIFFMRLDFIDFRLFTLV